jgi:hypothetical protein
MAIAMTIFLCIYSTCTLHTQVLYMHCKGAPKDDPPVKRITHPFQQFPGESMTRADSDSSCQPWTSIRQFQPGNDAAVPTGSWLESPDA